MEKIEVNGRTVEEAVQMAARELGITVDGVEYEVVEEGSKGFLGLGQAPTVITAWVREGYVPSAAPEVAGVEEIEVEEAEPGMAAYEAEGAPEGAEKFDEAAMRIVGEVISAMDLDAKPVLKSVDPEEAYINIEGKDVAILIGKHGQTLDALQYLVGIAAGRTSGSKMRIILDAEGYRDRHRQSLEKTAKEYADAVKREGQEAVLEPQSARDRRIIHMALAEDPDVYTYSEGEGDDRHVVISPKK